MTVVRNEQESPAVRQIDLHANEPIGMSRQVVKGDALAEVHRPLVECLIGASELVFVPPKSKGAVIHGRTFQFRSNLR